MSAITIALRLVAEDTTGAAFSSLGSNLGSTSQLAYLLGDSLGVAGDSLTNILGVTAGAGAAFMLFKDGLTMASDAAGDLQMATVMASIAISDGRQHVQEIEDAIVNMANQSVFKIADVDLAFRILGERGFDTKQILSGLGQTAIDLAEALGVQAVDGATLLGQAWYLFRNQGISVTKMADELTNAFYNNMNSVSSLTQFLGMAGGAAASLKVPLADLLTFGDMLTPMFGSASSAGSSLAYMMRNLAAPATSKVADEIKALNLHVFDANGNFVGLKSIMDQLFQDLQGKTDQQKMDIIGTLFNVKSGRAAMDLMGMTQQQFDSEFNDVQSKINQNGTTVKDANAITGTWQGTVKRLGTTWNDLFAKSGTDLNDQLQGTLDKLNGILSKMQQSDTVRKFFSAFLVSGAVLSGLTLLTIAFIVLGPILLIALGVFLGLVYAAGALATIWTVLHTKGDLFKGTLAFLNPLVDGLRAAFGWLGDVWQHQILPLFNSLDPQFKALAIVILALPLVALIGLFLGLAIIITGVVFVVLQFLHALQWIKDKMIELWNWMSTNVNIPWLNMIRSVQTAKSNVETGLTQMVTGILGILGTLSNPMGTLVTTAFNLLITIIFQHIPGARDAVGQLMGAIGSSIQGWFSNLYQDGQHLIQNLINGISSQFGALGGVVNQIGQKIFNVLGHSVPQEGPLSDDDVWGEHLVQNLAGGMLRGAPLASAAAISVAAALRGNLTTPSAGVTSLGSNSFAFQGAPSGGGTGTVIIPINLDSREIGRATLDLVKNQLQMNGMSRQFGR